jgi:hypothetical protein
MVSIKTIADGLSKQIEQAIAGKADVAQADVLCKSVDQLVKLARLQIEMAQIDWAGSDEKPVIEMESAKRSLGTGEGSEKALTATALLSNAPNLTFEQDLKDAIIRMKIPMTSVQIHGAMKTKCEIAKVIQTIAYWVSNGHMEKIGIGSLATYKVTDKGFFKQ